MPHVASQCFKVLAREHLNDGRGMGGQGYPHVYLHYVHI